MPAGFSPALARSVAERNVALRQAAEHYWSDLSRHEAARLLAVSMRRYSASGWQFERYAPTNPHPENSLKHFLWEALRARNWPLGLRQVERVLATTDHMSTGSG